MGIASDGKRFLVEYRHDSHVIIGDENSAFFRPHIRLDRWRGEASCAFGMPIFRDVSPVFDGETLVWHSPLDNVMCRFYEKRETRHEIGDLEFEILLLSAPASPTLVLPLETTGLDFYFQGPLSAEELERGNVRPPDVIGSYAVYHQSRKDNAYQTGKAFHIYRPEAFDANGSHTWCNLLIDEDELRITIPTIWLRNAAYPVLVDPTIGYTSVGASNDATGAYVATTNFTSSEAGDANPGTAYVAGSADSGTVTCMAGAYANGGANPNGKSKVNSGDASITLTTSQGAFRSAALTWTGIAASTQYWLAINNASGGNTRYDSSTGTIFYAARTHDNTMPATFPTNEGSFTGRLSMYIDYTTGGVPEHVPRFAVFSQAVNRASCY